MKIITRCPPVYDITDEVNKGFEPTTDEMLDAVLRTPFEQVPDEDRIPLSKVMEALEAGCPHPVRRLTPNGTFKQEKKR